MKIDFGGFFEIQLRKLKLDQNLTRKNDSLHEDRYLYIYVTSLKSAYDKTFLVLNCTEYHNTHFVFSNSFFF